MHSAALPFRLRLRLCLGSLMLALAAAPALAADAPPAKPLPAWEQLSAAQREQLLAPVRDRWNSAQPDERQRMLDHAARWQQMTPEQRQRARHGMRRWADMSPEQRDQMRALYAKMRGMDEAERKALKSQWRAMTPEQRRAWVQANPAPADAPDAPPPRD